MKFDFEGKWHKEIKVILQLGQNDAFIYVFIVFLLNPCNIMVSDTPAVKYTRQSYNLIACNQQVQTTPLNDPFSLYKFILVRLYWKL
jgi:hypothetical protein